MTTPDATDAPSHFHNAARGHLLAAGSISSTPIVRLPRMSEYQYYEFVAIDRPLSKREMAELRAISTRAEITTTSLTNTYHWGDFKGDPRKLMWKYFDAFVYVANWGTHRFMVRVPREFVDLDAAREFEAGDVLSIEAKGEHVLIEFSSNEEEPQWDEGGEPWMSSLLPVREAIQTGDLRCLYLGWLAAAGAGELADDDLEPPVPPGLGKLTRPLEELASFLRLDDDLIEVAAERSGPAGAVPGGPSRDETAAWIAALPAAEKDGLLLRVAEGDAQTVRMDLLRRFRIEHKPAPIASPEQGTLNRRTVSALLDEGQVRAEKRRRREAERKAAERARRERERAALAKYLSDLAAREDAAWKQVESMIDTKQQPEYDKAVKFAQRPARRQ
jgi:hypothetical protein